MMDLAAHSLERQCPVYAQAKLLLKLRYHLVLLFPKSRTLMEGARFVEKPRAHLRSLSPVLVPIDATARRSLLRVNRQSMISWSFLFWASAEEVARRVTFPLTGSKLTRKLPT